MKEALLYKKLPDGEVLCSLCSHRCRIQNGNSGICGVRVNKGGVLYTLVYAKAVALNVDPIEKKPLYHYLPGSLSFSIAAAGCNFRCGFCQNWEISQLKPQEDDVLGKEVLSLLDSYLIAGMHQMGLNKNKLVAGTYFLNLSIDNQTVVKPLIVY